MGQIKGVFNFLMLTMNVVFWVPILLAFAFLKWLLPIKFLRTFLDHILIQISQSWITCNGLWIRGTQKIKWQVQGINNQLDVKNWYMVISNHQSWVDIFVLQFLFNRKIPFLKFFLKKELIYVPFMGLAWWALDFPFMRRYSKSYLKKYPEKKGQDFELTKIACQKFKRIPTSVMNFVEGTRYSLYKHGKQNSPYLHLLRPKAGGLALALEILGQKFHSLIDVTIIYPGAFLKQPPSFWDFLCGRVREITVYVNSIQIPDKFIQGGYHQSLEARTELQNWLNEIWAAKDLQIQQSIHMGSALPLQPKIN